MPLVPLRQPDEITLSVEKADLTRVIPHRLSLTISALLSSDDDIDASNIGLNLPVTVDGTEYQCRDLRFWLNNVLEVETIVGWVTTSTNHSADMYCDLIFGLEKVPYEQQWRTSPVVIKAEDTVTEEYALNTYLKLKRSEQLQLLGL